MNKRKKGWKDEIKKERIKGWIKERMKRWNKERKDERMNKRKKGWKGE